MPWAPDEAVQLARLEALVRKVLRMSGLSREHVTALAKQSNGSCQSLFVSNAQLRDLFAALEGIDRARAARARYRLKPEHLE